MPLKDVLLAVLLGVSFGALAILGADTLSACMSATIFGF